MTTPKLRFGEFDGSWNKLKISEVTEYFVDGTHFSPKSTEGEYKYITSKNIRNEGLDLTNISYISAEEHEQIYKRCKIQLGDILLTKDGANTGNCCLNTLDEKFSLLSSVAVLRGKKSQFKNEFILQIFQSELGQNTIISSMSGQAITRITLTKLKDYSFYFPPIQEQTKIASFLSAVDEKISQLNQKHALLSQYKQGMMQKLFSQQIRFKADDGSEFGAWEETKFEKIGTFLKGKGISKADININGKTPCIRYGELYTSYGEVISKVISATNLPIENLILSKKNDVLIPASGETQIDIAIASCVLHDNVALSGDLNIFRTKESGVFLSYLICSYLKMQIAQLVQGNSVVHLYSSQLKGVELNLPCLEEQTKIANFLSTIDRKIAVVAQQIEQAKVWKKGLLQQMFV